MNPSTSLGMRSKVGMAKPSPPIRQAGNIGHLLVICRVCRRSLRSACAHVKYRCRYRVKNALAIRSGVKATVEIDISTSEVQPDLLHHFFQCFQALREQDHVRLIDGCHEKGSQHVAMVVGHGDDLLSFLVLVARVADAIAPFLATVLVPSPWSTLRSSCFSTARCRTLATNACHSDPSSAHFAKTL